MMGAPGRVAPRVLAVAAGLTLASLSLSAQSPARGSAPSSPGERLYMTGLSVAGSPVDATVQGDIQIQSTAMACVNCHRRSGMGTGEGTFVVPSVVGSVLFAPVTRGAPQLGAPRTTGELTRPAYTDEALLRALRDGIDPAGRTLSATMPRYAVGEADALALGAYLRRLGEEKPPGVDETEVHIATIVTPRVSAARRASMLDVLRTFVRAKNGGMRHETRRRDQGPWDMKQVYEWYREWVLDEWELSGAPDEWPAQLEALYRKQPVYAIVSGIADEDWSPIHAFCAKYRIPAVLPQTPWPPPVAAGDGFYSLYFSQGVTLDAQVVARHLVEAATPASRVRQVSRCGTPGEVAAAGLARELGAEAIEPECVPPSTPLTAATWRALIGDADALVVWLDGGDMAGLEALADDPALLAKVTDVYLSGSLLGEDVRRVPAALAARALLADPFVAPDEFDRHAARALMWMKVNGVTPADRGVAVNALFAAVLAANALSAPLVIDSREYFVERIEHMATRSLMPSAYPSVSFDAIRRFASVGASLLKMPARPGEPYRKVQEWYVPKS